MNTKMEEILKFAVANKASDVHLICDVSPKMVRGHKFCPDIPLQCCDVKELNLF